MFAPDLTPRLGPGRLIAALLTFAGVALGGQSARADLMKFSFGGTISDAAASTGATPGSSFSGTFAFDPNATVAGPSYQGTTSNLSGQTLMSPTSIADGSGLSVSIGGTPVYANTNGTNVSVSQFDYAGQYGYAPGPRTTVTLTNLNVDNSPILVSLELTSAYKALYPNLNAPTSLKLSDFSSAILSVYSYTGGVQSSLLYRGTVDNLVPSPAPEPSTILILGVAVAGWYARSRRRSA